MEGKVLTVVKNSVVIKTNIAETKKAMNGIFNPNKLLNYEILYKNKSVGKISNIIGRTDDFFLVGTIPDKNIASSIVGEDVEILKQNKKKKQGKRFTHSYKKVKNKKDEGRIK